MATLREPSVPNLWDPKRAPKDSFDQLVYASNLLGSDLRVTNFGGGNTSLKRTEIDPLTGEEADVLWVKGSGGDLGSAKASNFASLYLNKVLALEQKFASGTPEDDLVPLYSHCTFNLNPTPCSIDTPLHAFVPDPCVSHLHADAVIAIAASRDAERLTHEVWGGKLGFLPWKRPGFELGLMLRDLIRANPGLRGALMGSHGYICWAGDWHECYDLSLELIREAEAFLAGGHGQPFGAMLSAPPTEEAVRGAALRVLPEIRGKVAHVGQRWVAHVDAGPEVQEFLGSEKFERLAKLGTSCPDHFLRTKIRPLVLDAPPTDEVGDWLDKALSGFREEYAAYYERCKRSDSPPMRNPNPSVMLVRGLGMIAWAKSPSEARITASFYRNAIEVMKGAEAVSEYTALPEQEAFDIEYWQLEEAKLRRMPPPKEFAGQVAVITGGANGIGLATAELLASAGACVALFDIDESALERAQTLVESTSASPGSTLAVRCDVTDPASVQRGFEEVVLKFGGIDGVVISAGNARRGSVAETSDADFQFLSDLLMKGYFLATREAARLLIRQGLGGWMVTVGSKNGVAVGSNAAIYSAAKSFELHLMRTAAADLAKYGIRCNAVNPDAVLQGSSIWNDRWREETAKLLNIDPSELPEYYRKRSMLGVEVSTRDVAEAIAWLASERRSGKTTGCVIPVDGGVREGFLR